MDVQKIAMTEGQAHNLWRKYQKDRHFEDDIDTEIRLAYRAIAKGEMVIQAIASIKAAGLNERGLPNLAITGAEATHCHLEMSRTNGDLCTVRMAASRNPPRNAWKGLFQFAEGAFPWRLGDRSWHVSSKAIRPIIPIEHRPRRALESYHVLWEAEWGPVVPVDPMLLRRFGRSDLWLCLAAWDLTEVERAALSTRIGTTH